METEASPGTSLPTTPPSPEEKPVPTKIDREGLRVRLRNIQLGISAGLVAVVCGTALSAPLSTRLFLAEPTVLTRIASILASRIWVIVAVPFVLWGMSRMTPLTKWLAPICAVLAGEAALTWIDLITQGEGAHSQPWLLAVRVGTMALGAWLASRAIRLQRKPQ